MAITTNITGYLYKSDGTKIITGNLIVSLTQDFISIQGDKVAPFIQVFSLSSLGLIDFDLYATSNSVSSTTYGQPYPTGLAYTFEFDPDPTNQAVALSRKNGYWRAMFDVPHVSDTLASNQIGVGALIPVSTSSVTYNPSYALASDSRMLLQSEKNILTGGVTSDAGSLHTHTTMADSIAVLSVVAAPSTPSANQSIIYMTSSGVSPNKQLSLVGELEDGTEFIIATAVV